MPTRPRPPSTSGLTSTAPRSRSSAGHRAVADAHATAHQVPKEPGGGNHADVPSGRDATTLGPDRGLAGQPPPRTQGGQLGVGDAGRAGASRAPPHTHRRTAAGPDPPSTHSSGPMRHLPPLVLATPMAPPNLSLHGVAPDPQRADRCAPRPWTPPPAGYGRKAPARPFPPRLVPGRRDELVGRPRPTRPPTHGPPPPAAPTSPPTHPTRGYQRQRHHGHDRLFRPR